MIKNCLSNNKASVPLKKLVLKSILCISTQDKGNTLLKILNSPLPFFYQALPISCTPSANIKINCKAFCPETRKAYNVEFHNGGLPLQHKARFIGKH